MPLTRILALLGTFAAAALLSPAPAAAQTFHSDDPVIRRMWEEGMERSQVQSLAQVLLDSIGPRLAGTPGLDGAAAWLLGNYAAWGIPARKEQVGTWIGWRHGLTHVDMTAPRRQTLEATILGFGSGTDGPVEGDVVTIPALASEAEMTAWLQSVAGKIVLLSAPETMCRARHELEQNARPETVARIDSIRSATEADYRARLALLGGRRGFSRLDEAGVAGVVTSEWSGGWGVNKVFTAPTRRAVAVDVSCEHYGMLFRMAERGQGPRLRIEAEAEVLPEVPQFNVVAELKGTELPNEYVILSAHYDSFHPAQGATDNGTGTVMMHEAMRILKETYPRPRRTILAGHWVNEEMGLVGSAAVSRHLVAHHLTTSSFYAIISDSGKALFIDYGAASGVHFGNFERATAVTDRIRFVEHSIARLRREYGLKSVDVAMPSHMHDDHLNGFPYLIRHHGVRVWCYENMKDVFENPRGYNLGCILGEEFKVSRTFRDGEKFKWEEFEFEVKHSPGHTEYQMALFSQIDGRRVAFTGDAFFPYPGDATVMRHNIIFRNHVENDSHLKSIRTMVEREPEMICPGHGRPFPVNRALMLATEEKFRRQQSMFFDLLPEGATDYGLDPSWLRLYPYQVLIGPGETQTLQVHVQSYDNAPVQLEVALIAPSEWRIEPDVVSIDVPPRGKVSKPVKVTVPAGWSAPGPRFAIAADVVKDGRYLGQITEAVVEIRGVF